MGDTLVNIEDGFSRAFLLAWVCQVSAAGASLASCVVNTGLGPYQGRCRNFLGTPRALLGGCQQMGPAMLQPCQGVLLGTDSLMSASTLKSLDASHK